MSRASQRRVHAGAIEDGLVAVEPTCAEKPEGESPAPKAGGPPLTWASLAGVLARRGPDHIASEYRAGFTRRADCDRVLKPFAPRDVEDAPGR
jgi:hypothetical protein